MHKIVDGLTIQMSKEEEDQFLADQLLTQQRIEQRKLRKAQIRALRSVAFQKISLAANLSEQEMLALKAHFAP